MSAVDHPCFDVITQLVFQSVADDLKRVAAVVAHQILHVFQQERLRLLRRDDPRYVEKKRTLRRAFKAVRPAQSVFLAHTGNGMARCRRLKRELLRLSGEASAICSLRTAPQPPGASPLVESSPALTAQSE